MGKKKKKKKKPSANNFLQQGGVMTFEKVCPSCGKIFRSEKNNSIYCSEACYLKGKSELHKNTKVISKGPEDFSWKNEHRFCKRCGLVFVPKAKEQLYCSFKCSEIQRDIEDAKRQQDEVKKMHQIYDEIERKRHDADEAAAATKKPHSGQFKKGVKRDPNVKYKKVCKFCGKDFETSAPAVAYCSDECKKLSKLQKNEAKNAEKKKAQETIGEVFYKKICPVCGEVFETKNKKKVYCSNKCQKKQYAKDTREKEKQTQREDASRFLTHGSVSINQQSVPRKIQQEEVAATVGTEPPLPITPLNGQMEFPCTHRRDVPSGDIHCLLTKQNVNEKICNKNCTFYESLSQEQYLQLLAAQNTALLKRVKSLEDKMSEK